MGSLAGLRDNSSHFTYTISNLDPRKFRRMQGLPLAEELNSFPPYPLNPSQESNLHEHLDLEVGSVPLLDHHIEGEVQTLEEGSLSPYNPLLTEFISPPIVELPSTRYVDHFY